MDSAWNRRARGWARLAMAGVLAGALLAAGSEMPAAQAAAPSVPTAAAADRSADMDCWAYLFKGNFFPNPVRRAQWGPDLKAEVTAVVQPAYNPVDLYVTVWTVIGQEILSGYVGTVGDAVGHRLVVADTSGWDSGLYVVRLEGVSSICGTKSFTERVIVS